MTPLPGRASLVAAAVLCATTIVGAHSGPPYPILSNQIVGAYDLSIWSDPDATDDGSPAGQFWVVIDPATRGVDIPAGTRATVTIRPLDREGPPLSGVARPDGSASRQFIALLMDHEGKYGVHVAVDGPLGHAEGEATVDATYDERPAPYLIAVYLFPFLALGAIWIKVFLRRRRPQKPIDPEI